MAYILHFVDNIHSIGITHFSYLRRLSHLCNSLNFCGGVFWNMLKLHWPWLYQKEDWTYGRKTNNKQTSSSHIGHPSTNIRNRNWNMAYPRRQQKLIFLQQNHCLTIWIQMKINKVGRHFKLGVLVCLKLVTTLPSSPHLNFTELPCTFQARTSTLMYACSTKLEWAATQAVCLETMWEENWPILQRVVAVNYVKWPSNRFENNKNPQGELIFSEAQSRVLHLAQYLSLKKVT
jgi:hypothetical protein